MTLPASSDSHFGQERGSAISCNICGALLMMIGLYLLLLAPGVGSGDSFGQSVVNLQRLTIGETFTISGAIFLAVAWRPRLGAPSTERSVDGHMAGPTAGSSFAGPLTPSREQALREDIARLEERKSQGRLSPGGERTLQELRDELAQGH